MRSTTTRITNTVVLTEEEVGDELVGDDPAWDELVVDDPAWDELVGDDPAWRIIHYYSVYKPNPELFYSLQ